MTKEETILRFKHWCQVTIGNDCAIEDEQMFNNIMALLEQEPKTGHWINRSWDDVTDENVECSACGKWRWGKTNYCPNCGSKMESEGPYEYEDLL